MIDDTTWFAFHKIIEKLSYFSVFQYINILNRVCIFLKLRIKVRERVNRRTNQNTFSNEIHSKFFELE